VLWLAVLASSVRNEANGAELKVRERMTADWMDPVRLSNAERLAASNEELLMSSDNQVWLQASDDMAQEGVGQWPDDHRRKFLTRIAPVAIVSGTAHCIPPSVTMAQAILESGWGRSSLTVRHGNLFGIKAGRSRGQTFATREVIEGEVVQTTASFRVYDSWLQSVEDHDRLLGQHSRYAASRQGWRDWRDFSKKLAPIYATDPNYARHLANLIERYGLDRWDSMTVKAAEARGNPCVGAVLPSREFAARIEG